MGKLRVSCFSVSADGFGAGGDQGLDHPLGRGGLALHAWMYPTKTFQAMVGGGDGETGVDDEFVARGMDNIGAWILGRNMFGPVRGAWPDDQWQGWWGANPPYHTDVFVLTHHARAPLKMDGGTVFHFVTDGIEAALDRARAAAGDADVRLGGGVATIRAYLQAGVVDEMHLAVSPCVLGRGEHLLGGLDLVDCGLKSVEYVGSQRAAHYVFSK